MIILFISGLESVFLYINSELNYINKADHKSTDPQLLKQ